MRLSCGSLCRILLILMLVVSVGACQKKAVPTGPAGEGGPMGAGFGSGGDMGGLNAAKYRELGLNTPEEIREFENRRTAFENQDIYYDYDAYVLTEPAKRILDEKIAFLKRYAKVRVTVEGHCDERGTTEYNLALGERRANSAMQYIKNSGLSISNLTSVSYGKERPIAMGHDEASWAKNRRAHFLLNF